ncbi:hypothetical protein D3C71_1543150 [compost metagenome]
MHRVEGFKAGSFAQATTQHKTPVTVEDLIALRLTAEEIALLQRMILIDEAMIGSDQQVTGIGVGQLFHQTDQLTERFLGRRKHSLFGITGVAGLVDQVVINVNHLIVAQQGTRVGLVHRQ